MKLVHVLLGSGLLFAAIPAFGEALAPRFLIVRVPAIGVESVDGSNQLMNGEADVFPIEIPLDRDADGTIDKAKVREKLIQAIQTTVPVVLKGESTKLEDLPGELQSEFTRAEHETEGVSEEEARVVAWRHYGPVTGYSAGVVAHGRAPAMGYRPGVAVPYYGYYAGGQTYNYAYGAYQSTPSYNYYGYYRGF